MQTQFNLRGRDVVRLLETNDKAIGRALVVLRNNQTNDEQIAKSSKYHNMKGFRPCDAKAGTEMAEFFLKEGYLTKEQINHWRQPYAKGGMRISIYWRQLLRAAYLKQRQAAKAA